MMWFRLILTACFAIHVQGKIGFGGTEQEWGYTSAGLSRYIFWWLYYVNPVDKPMDFDVYSRPLIIWLQGGPGFGSSSLGNFLEFGPLDLEEKPRNTTWMNDYNVLLIDAPAGSGYSYVEDRRFYNTKDADIKDDVVECISSFLSAFPKFQHVPTYIVGQSYGGKVAVKVASVLYQWRDTVKINLKGVALGSPAISLIDAFDAYSDYAYSMGLIDEFERALYVNSYLVDAHKQLELGNFTATNGNGSTIGNRIAYYSVIDRNNIILKKTLGEIDPLHEDSLLNNFMNNRVAQVLEMPRIYGTQGLKVYDNLVEEIAKPAVDDVINLFTYTDLKIVVYVGQFDMVIPMAGTETWINRLFVHDESWKNAKRTRFIVDDRVEGFEKHSGRFSLYWVHNAGHQAPRDNPAAVNAILKKLTTP